LPRKDGQLERLNREVEPLEVKRLGSMSAAKEARRRKEEGGGVGDELEARGRWLRANEVALGAALGVEA
jgi:hypothetical protein